MRRGRTLLVVLALILIIGLVLAVFVLPRVIPSLSPKPTSVIVQVYFVSQTIGQGDAIAKDHLVLKPMPQDLVAGVMFTSDEEGLLVGRFAKYPLTPGVVVTTDMISNETGVDTGGPQIASLIPIGMNAIAIPITRLGSVGYAITDGARVNITACMLMADIDPSYQTILPNNVGTVAGPSADAAKMPGITLVVSNPGGPAYQGRTEVEPAFQQGIYIVPSEPQRPRLVCQMILQDVRVLKLGTYQSPAPADPNQATPVPAQQTAPDIVTLVVSPQDAITLTYMIYANIPLNLTLRRGGDDSRQQTEAATLQFLLSQYNIPVPVKLAYGINPRVDVLTLPFLPNDIVTVPPE